MKKLLPFLLTILCGIVFSACSVNGSINNDLPTQSTSKKIEYSDEYLKSVKDDIDEYFQSFDEESYQNDKLCQLICGISIINGSVEVCLTEPTDENIELFREKVSDSESIVFKKGTKGSLDIK